MSDAIDYTNKKKLTKKQSMLSPKSSSTDIFLGCLSVDLHAMRRKHIAIEANAVLFWIIVKMLLERKTVRAGRIRSSTRLRQFVIISRPA
ncbi:MAG: hypothetical protein M0R41_11630 [Methylobacter tundripaludum]|uniref:hypothetical protein n=1 Tax=Methylobacter tundripaludum TaxID=173365 RepID=UPI0011B0E6E6|nr:hypothetical protein [Methylobacter tundripaludum]MCK9636916.1 hypothetical protein [Methylobacter tundripaludum]